MDVLCSSLYEASSRKVQTLNCQCFEWLGQQFSFSWPLRGGETPARNARRARALTQCAMQQRRRGTHTGSQFLVCISHSRTVAVFWKVDRANRKQSGGSCPTS